MADDKILTEKEKRDIEAAREAGAENLGKAAEATADDAEAILRQAEQAEEAARLAAETAAAGNAAREALMAAEEELAQATEAGDEEQIAAAKIKLANARKVLEAASSAAGEEGAASYKEGVYTYNGVPSYRELEEFIKNFKALPEDELATLKQQVEELRLEGEALHEAEKKLDAHERYSHAVRDLEKMKEIIEDIDLDDPNTLEEVGLEEFDQLELVAEEILRIALKEDNLSYTAPLQKIIKVMRDFKAPTHIPTEDGIGTKFFKALGIVQNAHEDDTEKFFAQCPEVLKAMEENIDALEDHREKLGDTVAMINSLGHEQISAVRETGVVIGALLELLYRKREGEMGRLQRRIERDSGDTSDSMKLEQLAQNVQFLEMRITNLMVYRQKAVQDAVVASKLREGARLGLQKIAEFLGAGVMMWKGQLATGAITKRLEMASGVIAEADGHSAVLVDEQRRALEKVQQVMKDIGDEGAFNARQITDATEDITLMIEDDADRNRERQRALVDRRQGAADGVTRVQGAQRESRLALTDGSEEGGPARLTDGRRKTRRERRTRRGAGLTGAAPK